LRRDEDYETTYTVGGLWIKGFRGMQYAAKFCDLPAFKRLAFGMLLCGKFGDGAHTLYGERILQEHTS
jgi:hypothetical protein